MGRGRGSNTWTKRCSNHSKDGQNTGQGQVKTVKEKKRKKKK